MTASALPNEQEITNEVLLKLNLNDLRMLPRACKVCPDALWQTTGTDPLKLTVRCFCPLMHVFTWGAKGDIPIQDCTNLYREEEEKELPDQDESDVPAFLRQQQGRGEETPVRDLELSD